MRRPLRYSISLIVGLILGAAVTLAFAQATPPPQPPPATCEQQLEQAQLSLIQAKKEKAQCDFGSATIEEFARACKKQLDAKTPEPPNKAKAEAPAPSPAPPKK